MTILFTANICSGGGGGDGGWRGVRCRCEAFACGVGVQRAACGGGVRWRRAATECGGACGGGVRRRAARRGNRFGTME